MTGLADRRPLSSLLLALLFLLSTPAGSKGAEDFSFDLSSFEKKPLEWGGFAEIKFEHMDIGQDSALARLNLYDQPRSDLDRLSTGLQLDGRYSRGITSFNWVLKATAQQDQLAWADTADIYEAAFELKPLAAVTLSAGKKSYKWGKGYAWNPVGFINRPKDANNPEEALEGYIVSELDLIRSMAGPLTTVALTTVVLPVQQGVNEDFGEKNQVNAAAKLYLLYRDTDIDLMILNGNSRSNRYGIDFSRNLATNFEIHGELAYIPELRQSLLQDDNSLTSRQRSALSTLLGIRYLSKTDLTSIIEYYHNGGGYSEAELAGFFSLIQDGYTAFQATGSESLLQRANLASLRGYGQPQPGRNYLYARLTRKDPFDLLYLSPGVTAIVNIDDQSWSLSPEVAYSGWTNWELRFRLSLTGGVALTEFGSKLFNNRAELRLRYFF
ncbi:MAG: hypothetical protein K0A99_06735 [Desulfoarculaceae bacterium]|nr:hypothetical protein [Desulfoarculaceae bacterium]